MTSCYHSAMRTILVCAMLALCPLSARADIVTGADIISVCARRDAASRTMCDIYLQDVLHDIRFPPAVFGLTLDGVAGVQWESCPMLQGDKASTTHWREWLPVIVVRHWERRADHSRLLTIPWRMAITEAVTKEFPRCAAVRSAA